MAFDGRHDSIAEHYMLKKYKYGRILLFSLLAAVVLGLGSVLYVRWW
jgi:hypothetical protein